MDYIFFDFNGTLLNDVDLCLNLLNDMLKMKKHHPISKKKYLEIFTFPVINYYKKAGFNFPEDNFEELANYFIKNYTLLNKNCSLYDDIKEVLQALKNEGKHLYILSASEQNLLINQVNSLNIASYFDDIIGKDNIFAEGKSEIGIEFITKKQLPKNKCLFIGDTIHDKEVADKMGIQCILIARGHQSKSVLKTITNNIYDTLKEINFK